MQRAIDMLKRVKDSIINAYELKTGMSRTKPAHLMDAETWMGVNKAAELGFEDEVIQRRAAVDEMEVPQASMLYSKTAWLILTFEKNLGLRNKDGEYNLLAQLLSDNSHFLLRVSIIEGETKGSDLFSVREFGNNCLLYTLDEVLRYADVLNLVQADESERVAERPETPLFDNKAFREAIINAILHNLWISGNEPMISVFLNRIEILSRGTLAQAQTMEGFFLGESIPLQRIKKVGKKLGIRLGIKKD